MFRELEEFLVVCVCVCLCCVRVVVSSTLFTARELPTLPTLFLDEEQRRGVECSSARVKGRRRRRIVMQLQRHQQGFFGDIGDDEGAVLIAANSCQAAARRTFPRQKSPSRYVVLKRSLIFPLNLDKAQAWKNQAQALAKLDRFQK